MVVKERLCGWRRRVVTCIEERRQDLRFGKDGAPAEYDGCDIEWAKPVAADDGGTLAQTAANREKRPYLWLPTQMRLG
jgi:hypothetical protein